MIDIETSHNPLVSELDRIDSDPLFLHYDFQGWPVYKKTLRELLIELGAVEIDGLIGFNTNNPMLDTFPETLEDDGMAYGINEMFFSEANISKDSDGNNKVYFWRDKKWKE